MANPQRIISTVPVNLALETFAPTNLAEVCLSLNKLAAEYKSPMDRIAQLAEYADRTILLTSGGRNAPQSISYLAEAIEQSPKDIARKLLNIPVVFLDLQNHPKETYQLLLDLKLRYPSLNFRRFTYDLPEDSALKQAVNAHLRVTPTNLDSEDPRKQLKDRLIKAFFQETKLPLIYTLLKDPKFGFEKVDYIIGGNRRSQTDSRATLPFAKESFYEDRGFLHIYPLFDQTDEQVNHHVQQAKLPEHQLDASAHPSVGIWYEMYSFQELVAAQNALTKVNRPEECGMHFPQTGLHTIPIREVTNWLEPLDIAERYPKTHSWMLEQLANISTYSDFQI